MHFLKDHGFVHRIASDITPREVYEDRRTLLKSMAAGSAGLAMASWAARDAMAQTARPGKLAALASKRSTVPAGMTLENSHPTATRPRTTTTTSSAPTSPTRHATPAH